MSLFFQNARTRLSHRVVHNDQKRHPCVPSSFASHLHQTCHGLPLGSPILYPITKIQQVVRQIFQIPGHHIRTEHRHVDILRVNDHVAKQRICRRGVRSVGRREFCARRALHLRVLGLIRRSAQIRCRTSQAVIRCGGSTGKRRVQVQQEICVGDEGRIRSRRSAKCVARRRGHGSGVEGRIYRRHGRLELDGRLRHERGY
jgi:hypothetical protein